MNLKTLSVLALSTMMSLSAQAQGISDPNTAPTSAQVQSKALSSITIPNQKEKVTAYFYARDEKREPCTAIGFLCIVEDGSQEWIQGTYNLIVVKNNKIVSTTLVGGQNYRSGSGELGGKIGLLNPKDTKDYLVVVPSVGSGAMNFYHDFYRLNEDGSLTKAKLFLSDGRAWELFANFNGEQNKDGTITSSEPFYRADEKTISALPGKLDEYGFLTLNFTYRNGNFYADLPTQPKE